MYVAVAGVPSLPRQNPRLLVAAGSPARSPRLVDLRDGAARVRRLSYPRGDVVVVSGLPGGGKSTLMRRAAGTPGPGGEVLLIDSQDVRSRWQRRMPGALPYAVYRPLVRVAHYAGLWRALRSGASVVVHDCGTLPWVRGWLARDARRRGRGMHLVLLDVAESEARDGQRARGRKVSSYAMLRHRRAARRLLAAVRSGPLPPACRSVLLLDRAAARGLDTVAFDG
jgi:predicted kinase